MSFKGFMEFLWEGLWGVAYVAWVIFILVFPFMVLSRFKALDRAMLDANLQIQKLHLELAERLYEMEKTLRKLAAKEAGSPGVANIAEVRKEANAGE